MRPGRVLPFGVQQHGSRRASRCLCSTNTFPAKTVASPPKVSTRPLFDMLAVQSTKQTGSCTPNIFPCRIHHDGPVNASERYWAPTTADGQCLLLPMWNVFADDTQMGR